MNQQTLEKYLWGAATYLRGHIDADDYKQFIFPLLFFKRICDEVIYFTKSCSGLLTHPKSLKSTTFTSIHFVFTCLSNLSTVGHGLAELRGLYGTGHGQHGTTAGLAPRHAKLAVGAAATLAMFLFETHEQTK